MTEGNGRFPHFPGKTESRPIADASDFIAYMKRSGRLENRFVPRGIVFAYQGSVAAHAERTYGLYTPKKWIGSLGLIGGPGGAVALAHGFGIGAPAAVVMLEEYIALGVRRFLSIGSAGSLDPGLGIGGICVCDRALRDEGTSWHYDQGSPISSASPAMTGALCRTLERRGIEYRVGGSWTTDAPFRETRAEADRYCGEGLLTVEMEASALFTVAACRGVEMGAAFAVSDNLSGDEWNPRFGDKAVTESLNVLFDSAVEILSG